MCEAFESRTQMKTSAFAGNQTAAVAKPQDSCLAEVDPGAKDNSIPAEFFLRSWHPMAGR